jgi:polyisoprenoid-binding protein YceI
METTKKSVASTATSAGTRWVCDPAHSEIRFGVRHMIIHAVTGHFDKFNIYVVSKGEDFTSGKVLFVGKVDSVTSHNDILAKNLKSKNFFDAQNHPEISFESESITKTDDRNFKLTGNLTIRGVTKPVTLNLQSEGPFRAPDGVHINFTAKGKINRRDFGIEWGTVMESGGLVLSDDVYIDCEAEFIKEK